MRGLRKTFSSARRATSVTVAIERLDLDVGTGTFASVLGPSGSGKTTLLRCIAGFERPDAGVITVQGRELVSSSTFVRPYARGIGIVPQEGALLPHLTVAQNIAFGLVKDLRRGRHARVAELLTLVGLTGLGERRPDQLSGGQQQRVALARALAPEPALILMDEPFSGLDAQLRVELREEVRDLLKSIGSTALLVTHDQAEAMSLSDHLIVMRQGRIVAAGDPQTVYERPADAELGRFLGEALIVPGEITHDLDGVRVVCALGRLDVGNWHGGDGACQVLIRPEQIGVRADSDGGQPGVVLGTIRSQSYFGHDALMRIGVPGVVQPISVRVPGRGTFHVGDQAVLEVLQPVSTYQDEPHVPEIR